MSDEIFSANSALIDDELLMELVKVIEQGYPAGPNFLYALNTFVEASVLHERLYCDPSREFTVDAGGLQTMVANSDLVQRLCNENVLVDFPSMQVVDDYLAKVGVTYDSVDFAADMAHTYDTTCFMNLDAEREHYNRLGYLSENYPTIFRHKTLLDYDDAVVHEELRPLEAAKMPKEYFIFLEGLNHRSSAYVDISQHLRLNLYMGGMATVHHLGAIRRTNNHARRMYEEICGALSDAEDVGDTDYTEIEVPPLAQIALVNSRGDAHALSDEISALRHRHRRFRSYLTEYDLKWQSAVTKKERLELQTDFNKSWSALLDTQNTPRDRLIYKLWDIFKAPSKAVVALGDRLVALGRTEAAIGQVRGLRMFWNDLANTPVNSRNRELFNTLFPLQADEELWAAARSYGDAANASRETNLARSTSL